MYQAAAGKGPIDRGKPVQESDAPGAEMVQGFIKEKGTGNGVKKAAKFLLLLDKEDAAKVISHMKESEVEELSREIALIKKIDTAEARELLREFGLLRRTPSTFDGGIDAARKILETAFGKEKALAYLKKAAPGMGRVPFDFLNELEYHQIQLLIKNEPISVVGSILQYLQPKKSSLIIQELPPDQRTDVVKRIAKMEKLAPEVIEKIEEVLRERVRTQGKMVTQEIDGRSILARILRHMNITAEERILEGLSEVHPEVSDEVKEKLFTIDSVLKIEDVDLQEILREFSDEEIAVILKGKSEIVFSKILDNVSERRRAIIRDEMDRLGAMRRVDVDKSTREFLEYLRSLEEQHRLVIRREDEYLLQ